MLDLKVKVININPDENHEVLKKCQVLKEYGQFIDVINEYQEMGVEDAYKRAIEYCIENGILSEYLSRKGSEVVNMLIAEYDYDLDIEVQREEAYEDGMEVGKQIGIEIGSEQGANRINELVRRLIEDERMEDLKKSTEDVEYQKKLLEEYEL